MANENEMLKFAARALIKLAQENQALRVKTAQSDAKERALAVAHRLAERGSIEYNQVLEKAAALAKEDLSIIEKAIDLNLTNMFKLGEAEISKEASSGPKVGARESFEQFILNNLG